jgi:hypothetical protein
MCLSRANEDWLEVMESWLAQITEYITEKQGLSNDYSIFSLAARI